MIHQPVTGSWRAVWTALVLAMASGCGGGGGSPAPAPVAAPPAPAPRPIAVAPAPAAATKKAPPANPAARNAPVASANEFPAEAPEDVFVAGSEGAPMLAEPAPDFREEDRLAVRVGLPGMDSSRFQVAAVAGVLSGTPRADWSLPEGFTAVTEYGYSPDGYPLRIRGDEDGKLMAFVPGGTVRMGSNAGPPEAEPEFVVFLDPFYMDVTEVTVEEYEKYRQSLRDAKKRAPPVPSNVNSGRAQPALGIAWGDASGFVKWAKKELPTEAEFEKAARGSDAFPHPWGAGRPVWPAPRNPSTITEVGRFPGDQSPYGIYDLAGNAREWLQDWYSPTAHQDAAKISAQRTLTNWAGPKKAAQGSQRVVKGCGPEWQVWYRRGSEMHERHPDVGFRGVLRIDPAVATTAG